MTTTRTPQEIPPAPARPPSAAERAWADEYARAIVTVAWRLQDTLDWYDAEDAAAADARRGRRRDARRWRGGRSAS